MGLAGTANNTECTQMGVQSTVPGALQTHGVRQLGCEISHTLKATAVPARALLLWLRFRAMLFRKQAWCRYSWDRTQREGLTCEGLMAAENMGWRGTPTYTSHSRLPDCGLSLCHVCTCVSYRRVSYDSSTS